MFIISQNRNSRPLSIFLFFNSIEKESLAYSTKLFVIHLKHKSFIFIWKKCLHLFAKLTVKQVIIKFIVKPTTITYSNIFIYKFLTRKRHYQYLFLKKKTKKQKRIIKIVFSQKTLSKLLPPKKTLWLVLIYSPSESSEEISRSAVIYLITFFPFFNSFKSTCGFTFP